MGLFVLYLILVLRHRSCLELRLRDLARVQDLWGVYLSLERVFWDLLGYLRAPSQVLLRVLSNLILIILTANHDLFDCFRLGFAVDLENLICQVVLVTVIFARSAECILALRGVIVPSRLRERNGPLLRRFL